MVPGMADPHPITPGHVGSALSLTGLVALMTSESVRPDILGLACGCLTVSLVAFTIQLCHAPKPKRSRKARRPIAPRTKAPAPMAAQPVFRNEPKFHPALLAQVAGAAPLPPGPVAPPTGSVSRRALRDVRNRRIARGT
jgi:hypothetical protein